MCVDPQVCKRPENRAKGYRAMRQCTRGNDRTTRDIAVCVSPCRFLDSLTWKWDERKTKLGSQGNAHCNDRQYLRKEHYSFLTHMMPTSIALSGARGSDTRDTEDCSTSTAQDIENDSTECPPDGGYGWICVACCFAVNCFTWGVVAVGLPSTMMRTANSSSHRSLLGCSYPSTCRVIAFLDPGRWTTRWSAGSTLVRPCLQHRT